MISNGHSLKITLIFSECRLINIVVMRRKEPYKRGKIILFQDSLPLTLPFHSTLGTISSLNATSRSTFSDHQDDNLTCQPMRVSLATTISTAHPLLSRALESSSTTLQTNGPPLLHTARMDTTSALLWSTIGVIRCFYPSPNPLGTV